MIKGPQFCNIVITVVEQISLTAREGERERERESERERERELFYKNEKYFI